MEFGGAVYKGERQKRNQAVLTGGTQLVLANSCLINARLFW